MDESWSVADGTPARVVVIDDEITVLHTVAARIDERPDLRVVGLARDGEHGVRIARALCPDAIVLDDRLPRLDALDALPLLRHHCPRAVIVFYSDGCHDGRDEVALQRGADTCIDKRVPPAGVARRLHDLLAPPQLAAAAPAGAATLTSG